MNRRRKVALAILIAIGVGVLATTAYALTQGANLQVGLPKITVAGRTFGGRPIGVKIGGLRSRTALAALVNGDPIYWSEVDRQVARAALQFGVDLSSPQGAAQRQQITGIVLDQLIDQRLILQAARRHGVEATPGEVTQELDALIQQFGSEGEFQAALVQRNLTMADVQELIRIRVTVRKLLPTVGTVQVSEAEVRQAFEKNRAEYNEPEQVRVSHILVRVESPDQEATARNKLVLIQARLSRGDAFEDLARQYSEDPGSRERGGDLGWVRKGALVPEFERAAFTLPIGQVSEPVKTTFGYHILKVHERKAARVVPFEEVRAQVRERLVQEGQEAAFQKWLEAERKRATIRRFDRPTS